MYMDCVCTKDGWPHTGCNRYAIVFVDLTKSKPAGLVLFWSHWCWVNLLPDQLKPLLQLLFSFVSQKNAEHLMGRKGTLISECCVGKWTSGPSFWKNGASESWHCVNLISVGHWGESVIHTISYLASVDSSCWIIETHNFAMRVGLK